MAAEKKTTAQTEIEEMIKAGVHFGHKTSKTHPRMLPYIIGVRNTIHIIDVEKTAEKLQEAILKLKGFVLEKKVILLVGAKVQLKGLVEEIARECRLPYVSGRWIGGLLTNFETVSKRIEHLKTLETKKASGEFLKYTKKEQLGIEVEIKRLQAKFGGLKSLIRLPDVLFVVDLDENELVIREAKRKGLAVFAISGTDTDPTSVDYPIPANNDAISSVRYILERVKDVILEANSVQQTSTAAGQEIQDTKS